MKTEQKRHFCCVAVIAALAAISIPMQAQSDSYFEPYKQTNLRLPSIPLVVNDPYFSIWAPYNTINEGTTRHWTNAEKPLDGLLRVDGTTYRFLGAERKLVLGRTLLPMADEQAWTAKVCYDTQTSTAWTSEQFDDTSWSSGTGAFGSADEYPNVNTSWTATGSDIYVRRTLTLTADDLNDDLYAIYSHDDVFQLYINGVEAVSTGETWLQGEQLHITGKLKEALHEGTNIIAAHCHNTTGGALIDYGIYVNAKTPCTTIKQATQKSINVLATNTYCTMACGPVELDLVFTAPMLIDDLDLLSTPINYISFRVRSTDNVAHDVQFYFAAHPEIATNTAQQRVSSRYSATGNLRTVQTGVATQKYLNKTGDGVCIDWGYLYLPYINGSVGIYNTLDVESYFDANGEMPESMKSNSASKQSEYPTLAFFYDFGQVVQDSSYTMIGYDEVYDMRYMDNDYKGYWARDKKTIKKAFCELRDNYDDIMQRCRAFDRTIYDDAYASGGTKYADLLSGSYRHVIAAHKLFQDKEGHLLFFSKENNSGGFVNTVDLTYPESPLFLLYNPELQKAMMTSIFEYCSSDRWGFNFSCHDLGIYPHANGQSYSITRPNADGGFGGNMPLEETGNMLTLAAMITLRQGDTSWIDEYWDTITTWAEYLADNGQDPANQLCTDDFAGFLAHNANLSIKAIMGVAAYSFMAKAKGLDETAQLYMDKARSMAKQWQTDANDGDHYKLALDRDDTWSQKYNMVWDKLWQTKLFDDDVMTTEIAYYLDHQNVYGLPLDSRSDITKADWIMWTAAMTTTSADFNKLLTPLYNYVNRTKSRVPISDYYNSRTGLMVGFKARSVIGGFWMKVLFDHFDINNPTLGVSNPQCAVAPQPNKSTTYYSPMGCQLSRPQHGLNIKVSPNGQTTKYIQR